MGVDTLLVFFYTLSCFPIGDPLLRGRTSFRSLFANPGGQVYFSPGVRSALAGSIFLSTSRPPPRRPSFFACFSLSFRYMLFRPCSLHLPFPSFLPPSFKNRSAAPDSVELAVPSLPSPTRHVRVRFGHPVFSSSSLGSLLFFLFPDECRRSPPWSRPPPRGRTR